MGDRVKIHNMTGFVGGIVELRGPKGAQVYRVRLRGKPKPSYTEVLAEQLELVPTKA